MDKEKMKVFGTVAGKIGKKIFVTGALMGVLGAINVAVTTVFTEGTAGLKKKNLDDFLQNKKQPEKVVEKVEAEVVETSKVEEA